jgi:heme A synthase
MTDRDPFQTLALVTAWAVFVLITLGAVVRASGSGLGCPDWPLCHGRLLPPLQTGPIIEWSHRTWAALTGLGVVALPVAALRWRGRWRLLMSLGAVGLVGYGAWLGRIVVEEGLRPPMVAVHFATAFVLLALVVMLAVPQPWELRVWRRWLAVVGVFSVVVVGVLVRARVAGLMFPDWPLMDGTIIPADLDNPWRQIHFLHRATVLVVGGYLGWLAVTERRVGDGRWGSVLLGLYLVEVMMGALAVWLELPPLVAVLHVAVAALTWMAAVRLATGPVRVPVDA